VHADVAVQLGLRVLRVFYTQQVQPIPPDEVNMAWGVPLLRTPRDLHQALTKALPASLLKNHPLMLVCTKLQTEVTQEQAEKSGASVLGWVKAEPEATSTVLGQAVSLSTTHTTDTGTVTSHHGSTQGTNASCPAHLNTPCTGELMDHP
jgi:hypothetical protein